MEDFGSSLLSSFCYLCGLLHKWHQVYGWQNGQRNQKTQISIIIIILAFIVLSHYLSDFSHFLEHGYWLYKALNQRLKFITK